MSKRLFKAIDKLNYDFSIAELQRAHEERNDENISYHDSLYLNIIETEPNKFTSSQIADLLRITRPAVTQKINELAKKGYIIRTQSQTDKRVFYLSVSPDKQFYTAEDEKLKVEIEKLLKDKYGEDTVEKMAEMIEFLSKTYFGGPTKGAK